MPIELTDRELDVMAILWELEDATVTEVRDRLGDDLAYTSVLSVLRLLEQKGHVSHRTEGRAFRYYPLVAPEEAGRTLLDRILAKLYRGSPVRLLAHLVEETEISEDDLRTMREVVDRELEGGGE